MVGCASTPRFFCRRTPATLGLFLLAKAGEKLTSVAPPPPPAIYQSSEMRALNDGEAMNMELLAMDAENSVADTTGRFRSVCDVIVCGVGWGVGVRRGEVRCRDVVYFLIP